MADQTLGESGRTLTGVHLIAPAKPRLRGWSHAAASIAALTLCPIVIVLSPGARIVAAIFTVSTVLLFSISATYHRFPWGKRMHEVMKRLDHSMIFVAIAATYTPIAIAMPGTSGALILRVVWIGAAVGVVIKLFWPDAPRPISVTLYITVGWAALLAIGDVGHTMGVAGTVLLLVGGVLHTLGAVVYATQRPNPAPAWFGFHEIFHLFVIAAIATHYVAVATIALPKA